MAQSPIRFVAPSPGPATDLASTPPPPSLFRRESPTTAAMRAEREALEKSLAARRSTVKPVPVRPGVTAKPPAALERGPLEMATDFAGDSARSLLGRGTIGTGEGAVGLANIATALSPANIGARAASALLGEKAPDLTLNPVLDAVGYQPQVVRDYIAESDSEALKRARAEVEKAQGFLPTVEASLRNPSTIVQSAIESVPSMLAGQGVASGALKVAPSMAPILASALGEGALTAGQNAEQTRQESGTLTPGQAGAAVAAGGVTAGISRVAGRFAEKAGLADPDTLILAGRAASEKPRGLAARMIGGAISEGLLEEAPQSAQEQAFQNVAQGRPLGQGVMESAAQGMLTGGLMGAGSNVMPQRQAESVDNPDAPPPQYDAEDDFTSALLNPSIGPAQALAMGETAPPVAAPASVPAPAPSIRPSDVAGQIVWDAESQGRSPLSALIDSGLSTKDAKAVLSRVRANQPQAAAVPAPDASKVDADQDKAAAARRAEAKSPAPAPAPASRPTPRNATPEEEDRFLREAHDAVNRAASEQLRAEREARAERFATPWDNRFASGAAPAAEAPTADPFGQAERNAAFGLASSGAADVSPAPSPFEAKQEQFSRGQSEQQQAAEDAFYRKYAQDNGHAALVDALRTREGLSTSAAVEDAKAIEDGRPRKKRKPKPAQAAPADAAPSDAAGTPTSPQAASSSPRDASAQAPGTQAQAGTVSSESSPAAGTPERSSEPSPSSAPPPQVGESSDAVALTPRDNEGSNAAQGSEQVDDIAAENTDSSADGSTTVTARGRDFKVERTDKGFILRGTKGARYDVIETGPNRYEVKRNERRGMLGGRLGGPEDPLSGVTFAVKDGKLEVSNGTTRSAPARKVPGSKNPIADFWNSRKGPEEEGPEANFYRADQPNPDDYDAEGNEIPRGGPPSGPQNPSGDTGGGGVERQPPVLPSDKSALLEGPLTDVGAENVIVRPPVEGRLDDQLVADEAPKGPVAQGSVLVRDEKNQPDERKESAKPKDDEKGSQQGTESLPPKKAGPKASHSSLITAIYRAAENPADGKRFLPADRAKVVAAIEAAKDACVSVTYREPSHRDYAEQWTIRGDDGKGYLLSLDGSGRSTWHELGQKPKANLGAARAEVPEAKAEGQKYEFSSTQADLPPTFANAVRSLAAKIPDSALAGDGRENDPHVTVKFGTVTNDAADVRKVLEGQGPITITFGKLSTFPPSESSDGAAVLKLDIYSSDLQALNKRIGDALENTETFKYSPHVTVAYVDPAQVDAVKAKLSNPLNGKTVKIDRLSFSDRQGEKHEIKLVAEPKGMDGLTKTQRAEKNASRDGVGTVRQADDREAPAKSAKSPVVDKVPAGEAVPSSRGKAGAEDKGQVQGTESLPSSKPVDSGISEAPIPEQVKRPGAGENAREWMRKYSAANIEGRRALIRGLGGKLTYEDMRQLAAYTDDITTENPATPPEAKTTPFRPAKLAGLPAPIAPGANQGANPVQSGERIKREIKLSEEKIAKAKESLEKAKEVKSNAKGKREKEKIQKRIDVLDKEYDAARRAGWELRDERLKIEGDPAQKLITGKRYDQVDEKALTPIVREAVQANPRAKDFTKAQLESAIKSFASNEWTPFYGAVIDKGLEKAVDNSLDVKLGEIVQAKALDELKQMEGLDERTGYGQMDRFKYREELKRAYRADEIEKIMERAREDNKKGLEKKAEDDRVAAQQAEQERQRVESLKEPVPADQVAIIQKLTIGEYNALKEGVLPDSPYRLAAMYPSDQVLKRLGARGLVEKQMDPLTKTEEYVGTLTPAGQDMAKAVERYEARLKNGIPFAERGTVKGRWSDAFDKGSSRLIIGKANGHDFHSTGHWLVEGKRPAQAEGVGVFQELTPDRLSAVLTPKKKVEKITPVAYFETDTRGHVVMSNGSAYNASYFDYVSGLHPDAEFFGADEKDTPVYLKTKDGRPVGVIMPIRHEATPGVQAILDEKPAEAEKPGGPGPIISEMLTASRSSLLETAKDVSDVRYGEPGTILFEYKGKTFSAPEPTDVMPAKDTKGSNDEGARAWAAKQIWDKKAKGATAKEASKAETKKSIGDVGEKIGGAKKDLWSTFKDKMSDALDMDLVAQPLSKSWPEPDYEAMIRDGADPWSVGFIRAVRDEVPPKPQKAWRAKQWAGQVEQLRKFAFDLLNGRYTKAQLQEKIAEKPFAAAMKPVTDRAELYALVGHEKSLHGVRIASGDYSVFNGQKFDKSKTIWTVEKKAPKTSFSNWPKIMASGDTRAEALDAFKAAYPTLDVSPKKQAADFIVYSYRGKPGFYIGKKISGKTFDLAGPFDNVKEARAYKDAENEALLDKLEKIKEVPLERRPDNRPRVGEDHRQGKDITADEFKDAFGFRGVEFGNWVEQGKRQASLNEAYDALMDMAAILDIPPKAISLNGELGLAFGARGGGQFAAAHYESGKVVINLTKTKGAGSLGHEWWHALDNYFSRARGAKDGFMTTSVLNPGGANGDPAAEKVRIEMLRAYGQVRDKIRETALKARASKLDAKRSGKAYWTTGHEMSARAFESYLISKLQDQNGSNDYLANIVDEDTWNAAAALGFELSDSYPYPTAGEIPSIRAAFDNFFEVIESKETDKGVALFERKPSAPEFSRPTFYSALERSAEQMKQPMMAHDAARFLLDPKRGAKAAEAKWTGLDDFLGVQWQDGKMSVTDPVKARRRVTPAEVQDFLKANAVTVTEVTQGGPVLRADELEAKEKAMERAIDEFVAFQQTASPEVKRAAVAFRNGHDVAAMGLMAYRNDALEFNRLKNEKDEAEAAVREIETLKGQRTPTKFAQYQIPGGTNYREVLLTLPEKRRTMEVSDTVNRWNVFENGQKIASDVTNAQALEMTGGKEGSFRSSHFDEPNILAHVRFNERTDANGKRVLFLEEIQSDWAQRGRRAGFKQGPRDTSRWTVQPNVGDGWNVYDEQGREVALEIHGEDRDEAIANAIEFERSNGLEDERPDGVPPAPFVEKTEDWTALALKSMLHYAAANGYDSVAWTTGEMQAARYDLAKQVDSLDYTKLPGDVYSIAGVKDGREFPVAEKVPASKLEEYVGKDVAEKIIAGAGEQSSPPGYKRLSGVDLKVGGEGMRAFYDKIVPQVAEKLGKKFRAKVADLQVPTKKADRKLDKKVIADAAVRFIRGDDDANDFIDGADLDGLLSEDEAWALGEKYSNNDRGDRALTRSMAQNMAAELVTRFGDQKRMTVHSLDISPEMRASVREGQPLFTKRAATMTESQWQHYNARHDADRGESAREAYRRSETVNGAPTGVRVVDFEGDVDKQVVSMMVQWSAAIASKMGAAVHMLQRHVPALKFGGVTPAGNLHGVNVDGKVFINYLATHQLALEVAKKERITYEEAFSREAVNVLIHEAAHYAEKGHGPAFEAEMDRIKADLGPQALASMLRDFRKYAANDQNRTRTQRMYEKAAPGWIEGERRGREAAANTGAAGARGADAQQSERLRPRPRSDTGGDQYSLGDDEPAGGVRMARRSAAVDVAGAPGLRRPDGRGVDPSFSRKPSASTPGLVAQQEANSDRLFRAFIRKQGGDIGDNETKGQYLQRKTQNRLNRLDRAESDAREKRGDTSAPILADRLFGGQARIDNKLTVTESVLLDPLMKSIRSNGLNFDLLGSYMQGKPDAIESVQKSGKRAKYDEAAGKIDTIYAVSDSYRVKRGLVTPEELDDIRAKREKARAESTAHPIFDALQDFERVIIQDEHNTGLQAVAAFAEEANDPGFARVSKVGQDGPRPNSVVFRRDGREWQIDFSSPEVADSVRKLHADSMNAVARFMSKGTRWVSRVNTVLSPAFMVKNKIRDFAGAVLSAMVLQGAPNGVSKSVAAKIVGGQLSAMRGTRDYIKNPAGKFEQGSAGWWAQQAHKNAALPGYFRSIESLQRLESRLGDTLRGKMARKISFRHFSDVMMGLSELSEASTRVSVYRALVESGVSPAQAGDMARQTLDTNKTGDWTRNIGAITPFFNSSVQGAARLAQMMTSKDPGVRRRARAMMGGLVAAGAMLGAWLAASGGDDDKDGIPDSDQQPEWDTQRNLIIGGVKIPLPQGFSAPFYAGFMLSKLGRGNAKPAEAMFQVGKAFWDQFTPISSPFGVAQPAADLLQNQTFTGSPIRPIRYPGDTRPNSEKFFKSNTGAAKAIAKGLNRATFGDESESGYIDLYPGDIDYVAKAGMGAFGRFMADSARAVEAIMDGKPVKKVPVVGDFLVDEDRNIQSRYYDAASMIRDADDRRRGKQRMAMRQELSERYPGSSEKIEGASLTELRKAMRDTGATLSPERGAWLKAELEEQDGRALKAKAAFEEASDRLKALDSLPDGPDKDEKRRAIYEAANRAFVAAVKVQ